MSENEKEVHKYHVWKWKKIAGIPIIPQRNTIWQKSSSRHSDIIFKPSDYESSDAEERKRMAHDDAKNHAAFYRELITKQLLPPGTKVKSKRMRHSEAYHVEMTMPHVKYSWKDYLDKSRQGGFFEPGMSKNQLENFEHYRRDVTRQIKEIARKRGYSFESYRDKDGKVSREYTGDFRNDLDETHNYRFDNKGHLFYIDSEVLNDKLPFRGRKASHREKGHARLKEVLERKVTAIIAIGSFLGSIVFLSKNITGNIVGINETYSGWIGGILFILGLLGAFTYFNKR